MQKVQSKRSNTFLPAISDTQDTSRKQLKSFHKKSPSLTSVNTEALKELMNKNSARNTSINKIYTNSPKVVINKGGVDKFNNGEISVQNIGKQKASLLD